MWLVRTLITVQTLPPPKFNKNDLNYDRRNDFDDERNNFEFSKGYDDRHAKHYKDPSPPRRKREFDAAFRDFGEKDHYRRMEQQDVVAKVQTAPTVGLNADDYLAQFTTALDMEGLEDMESKLIGDHRKIKKEKKK